jgi:hypothetical protein
MAGTLIKILLRLLFHLRYVAHFDGVGLGF